MWLSTMKYFSPSFSYIVVPPGTGGSCLVAVAVAVAASAAAGPRRGPAAARPGRRRLVGDQVETDVLGRVLRVGEHDRPVVLVDHPAVVGGHVLLELGLVEEAWLLAERLGDLVVDEVHPAGRVHPDHRRQVTHGDVGLARHHLRDDRADL